MRFISETVQHEKYAGTGEDAHGNEIESWAAPVALGVYAFNPGTSSEPNIPGHDRVWEKPRLYVPAGADVNPKDRITVRGTRYEVDGEALDFRNPYSPDMDGLAIDLKAVTG